MNTNPNTQNKRDGGITLIELVVIVVALGILATVVTFATIGITNPKNTEPEWSGQVAVIASIEEDAFPGVHRHLSYENTDGAKFIIGQGVMLPGCDLPDVGQVLSAQSKHLNDAQAELTARALQFEPVEGVSIEKVSFTNNHLEVYYSKPIQMTDDIAFQRVAYTMPSTMLVWLARVDCGA